MRRASRATPIGSDLPRALDVAVRQLALRPRSVAEIRRKLRDYGAEPDAIEQTLQRLLELRYLDDEAFAKAKAGSLARQGFGPRAITARLAQAGVRGDAAAAGLERAVEPGEAELATAALEKRLKGRAFSSLDPKEKLRLQRWLIGRGFSGSAIRAASSLRPSCRRSCARTAGGAGRSGARSTARRKASSAGVHSPRSSSVWPRLKEAPA